MRTYIKTNYECLGAGNTREVYKDGDVVYKIASYEENEQNNKIEFLRYKELPESLKRFVPSMELIVPNDYEILKAEYIEPLENWVVRNNYLRLCDFLDACVDGKNVDELCEGLNIGLYFPYELIAFMRELGSRESELYYPANYGVKDNSLILLDFADNPNADFKIGKMPSLDVF